MQKHPKLPPPTRLDVLAPVEHENILPSEPENVQTTEPKKIRKVVSYKMSRDVERAVKHWAADHDLELGIAAERLLWLGLKCGEPLPHEAAALRRYMDEEGAG